MPEFDRYTAVQTIKAYVFNVLQAEIFYLSLKQTSTSQHIW